MKNQVTRRKFFAAAGMLTGVAMPWGKFEKSMAKAISLGNEAPRSVSGDAGKNRIVDMHMHYGSEMPDFVGTFLKLSERLNYTACVLTPFEHRKVIAEAAKKYPTQIIPFGALELDAPNVIDQVKEFHELGLSRTGGNLRHAKELQRSQVLSHLRIASQYGWI